MIQGYGEKGKSTSQYSVKKTEQIRKSSALSSNKHNYYNLKKDNL